MEKEIETNVDQNELSDLEIAELANKEIKERDKEIAKLKKDLAKAKLLSNGEDETPETMSRDECMKVLSDNGTCDYDYFKAVIDLCDNELSNGRPHPLGRDGEAVYTFLKEVLEECGDDKSLCNSIYQSRLAPDDKSIAMAYNKRK